MPYSAVTQPSPLPRKKPGTRFSTLAVHNTRVSPKLTSTEPSAWRVKPRSICTGRSALLARPLGRGEWVNRHFLSGNTKVYHSPSATPGNSMIRSMTAYAAVEQVTPWGTLACELRAVNHRFLELGVRLPEELRLIEPALREQVSARLARDRKSTRLN